MENQNNWPVAEIPPTGNKNWKGGAYTFAFVYSDKGNFLVKGYNKEIAEYLRRRREKEDLKYFVNFVFYGNGFSKSIWSHYDKDVIISPPAYLTNKPITTELDKKWKLIFRDSLNKVVLQKLTIKDMPKEWKPFLDKSYHTV